MGLFSRNKISPPSISGEPTDVRSYRVTGTAYECRKNPKKKRLDILKPMKLGDPVVLEFYEYEGETACMVVDCKSGLDIGVLHATSAKTLKEYYQNPVFIAKLTENHGYNVAISVDVYGERIVFGHISKAQAGVIYKAFKEKKLNVTKKDIDKVYAVADMEDAPKEFVSILRRAVERIFEEDYDRANELLKEAFK